MTTAMEQLKRAFEASGTAVFETGAGQVLIRNGKIVGKDEALLKFCEVMGI